MTRWQGDFIFAKLTDLVIEFVFKQEVFLEITLTCTGFDKCWRFLVAPVCIFLVWSCIFGGMYAIFFCEFEPGLLSVTSVVPWYLVWLFLLLQALMNWQMICASGHFILSWLDFGDNWFEFWMDINSWSFLKYCFWLYIWDEIHCTAPVKLWQY